MSESVSVALLERLKEAQAAAGLTDAQLSRLLGRADNYVGRLKTGARGKSLSLDFAIEAGRAFPEIRLLLSREIHTGTTSVPARGESA